MDIESIGTGLAILGTAEVSKDAVQRMLAPTADYIGAGVLQSTKAAVNTARVLAKAARRLGSRIDDGGQIPPRVLKNLLDDAPWIEDELMAEYLGGILASSFGDRLLDDRAVALQSTLQRLSSYAVRTHYLFYSQFYSLYRGKVRWARVYEDLENVHIVSDLRMYGPHEEYADFLGVSYDDNYWPVLRHSFASLEREDLLKVPDWGSREYLNRSLSDDGIPHTVPKDGFVYRTTVAGEELFLWALGRGDLDSSAFPDVDLACEIEGISMPTGFARLEDLRVNKLSHETGGPCRPSQK